MQLSNHVISSPVIQKMLYNTWDLANYCLTSTSLFLSKLTKKLVEGGLSCHLAVSLSGYRLGHDVEAALAALIDDRQVTCIQAHLAELPPILGYSLLISNTAVPSPRKC